MSKPYSVEVFFPELKPAHAADQRVSVNASSLGVAAARGLAEIRKREEVKGKRIRTARILVREV